MKKEEEKKKEMKKKDFYPLVKEPFLERGYVYYPENSIKGRRKPDFLAMNPETFVIGEIKSPAEPPKSSSWRTPQYFDSFNMRRIREKVREMERSGQLPPEVGGHLIILFGQLREYLNLMGKRWMPPEAPGNREILLAYAYHVEWSASVNQALEIFCLTPVQRLKGTMVEVIVFSPKQRPKGL